MEKDIRKEGSGISDQTLWLCLEMLNLFKIRRINQEGPTLGKATYPCMTTDWANWEGMMYLLIIFAFLSCQNHEHKEQNTRNRGGCEHRMAFVFLCCTVQVSPPKEHLEQHGRETKKLKWEEARELQAGYQWLLKRGSETACGSQVTFDHTGLQTNPKLPRVPGLLWFQNSCHRAQS